MSSATNAREFMIRQLAAELSGPMAEVLMNGFYNEGSSTIIRPKNNPTRKALVRRGLVHDGDNRWTALGREVARHLPPSWNSAAIKSMDELHEMAIAEDWTRTAAATGLPVAYDGKGGVIVPGAQTLLSEADHEVALRADVHMRAITFPKTGDTWTNAESGVHIAPIHSDGRSRYEVRLPALTPGGWQHFAYAKTLASARSIAKDAVESVAIPRREADELAAYREQRAIELDTAAYLRGVSDVVVGVDLGDTPYDRAVRAAVAAKVAEVPEGLCLRTDPPHIPHMRAVSSECRDEQSVIDGDAEGSCTSASVPGQHVFEYDVAEVKEAIAGNDGYDEFERCGKAPNDPVHE